MGKLIPNVGGGGGVDTDVVTADAADVANGKIFYGAGSDEPQTGTVTTITSSKEIRGTPAIYGSASLEIPATFSEDTLMRSGSAIHAYTNRENLGDAAAANVLTGKTFTSSAGLKVAGSMTNRGAQTKTFTPSGSKQTYTIPAGYHNGSGVVTCNAVPSTYIPISSANFFKNGALGSLYTLGVVPKVPKGYWTGNSTLITEKLKTFTLDGWHDTTIVAAHFPHKSPSLSSANIVNGELQIPMVYQGSYPPSSGDATYTTAYATRRTIDFTSIKTLRTNMRSLYSSHQINVMFWVMNTSTNLVLYYTRKITRTPGLLDIDVSSMNGQCIFGFWACEGSQNQNATAVVTEISLLQ